MLIFKVILLSTFFLFFIAFNFTKAVGVSDLFKKEKEKPFEEMNYGDHVRKYGDLIQKGDRKPFPFYGQKSIKQQGKEHLEAVETIKKSDLYKQAKKDQIKFHRKKLQYIRSRFTIHKDLKKPSINPQQLTLKDIRENEVKDKHLSSEEGKRNAQSDSSESD